MNIFQILWRSLYLRYYEDQTPQHDAWNEYLIIKEKELQLRSYVNKLRQYVQHVYCSLLSQDSFI